MQTAAGDLLVGRLLEGRYRILERIAQGGMSTVYAAVDERLDRLVAVKIMSAALSSDPKFGDRFAREARAAAKLTHVTRSRCTTRVTTCRTAATTSSSSWSWWTGARCAT